MQWPPMKYIQLICITDCNGFVSSEVKLIINTKDAIIKKPGNRIPEQIIDWFLFDNNVAFTHKWKHIMFRTVVINPFLANALFLYPLKRSENLWFCDIFRRYRKTNDMKWVNNNIQKQPFADVLQNTCVEISFTEYLRWLLLNIFWWNILTSLYQTIISINSTP